MREVPWLLPVLLPGRALALPACDAMCETSGYWPHYRNLRNLSQPASLQAELAKDVSRYLDALAESDIESELQSMYLPQTRSLEDQTARRNVRTRKSRLNFVD